MFLYFRKWKLLALRFKIFSGELSCPKIKNFLIFRRMVLSVPEINFFLYIGKQNFLALRVKAFLYFPQKRFSYISGNGTFRPRKNFLHFRKWNFLASYFSYISERFFPNSKNKKNTLWKHFLYFGKWNVSFWSLKVILKFQERTCKALKNKKNSLLWRISCLLWRFCNLYISKA